MENPHENARCQSLRMLVGERAAVALVAMLRFTADVRAEEADAKMFLFNEWQQ